MARIDNTINISGGVIPWIVIVLYKATAPAAEIDRIVYEDGVDPNPFNYSFTDIANGTYYVVVHESADGSALGNIRHDYWIDALTGTILFERFFFQVGQEGAPANGATIFEDVTLNGLTITGVFKEGFRFLWDDVEWQPHAAGGFELLAGVSFSEGEVWSYEVSRIVAISAPAPDDAFSDIVIATADLTLDATHYNKTILVRSAPNIQYTTLPNIAGVPDGKGFVIRHDRANAINVIVESFGSDVIRFDGGDVTEVILGVTEMIKVVKKTISSVPYWFVVAKEGWWNQVGEFAGWHSNLKDNCLMLNGGEYDPVTYVRLGKFVDSLPVAQVVDYATFDTSISIGGETVYTKRGFFAKDTITGKIKVPDLFNKHIRYLKNYAGSDTSRYDNKPGGYQHWAVGEHQHDIKTETTSTAGATDTLIVIEKVNGAGSPAVAPNNKTTELINSGGENNVRNIGLIPMVRI